MSGLIMPGPGVKLDAGSGCAGDYGYTTEGGAAAAYQTNQIRLTKIVIDCNSTGAEFNAFILATSASLGWIGTVIKGDDTGDLPGTILWKHSSLQSINVGTPQWYPTVFTGTITPGVYWVGVWSRDSNVSMRYDATGTGVGKFAIIRDFETDTTVAGTTWSSSTASYSFYIGF